MTTEIKIPEALSTQLPTDIDLTSAEVTTFSELCEESYVSHDFIGDIDDDAIVVIAPGWIADDGNAELELPLADTGGEAAEEYVETGEWGADRATSWVEVWAWRVGYVLGDDGEVVEVEFDRDGHHIAIDPVEPDCSEHDHDWQSPHGIVGGLEDNPGVQGHGGGVIITEVCAHCGIYRVTDTWAQCPSTGMQGLHSVEYREADSESEEWVYAQGLPEYSPGQFYTPLEYQGEEFTRSYAYDGEEEVIIERCYDSRDDTTIYTAYADTDPEGGWEPWNEVPELGEEIGPCRIY